VTRIAEEQRQLEKAEDRRRRKHLRDLRERDDARTALHQALAEVISAPSYTDTDCLIDQLEDRGFRVVRK
jgi:hypothetical protein